MPDTPVDRNSGASSGAKELLARAAAAELRARRALETAVDDLFLAEDGRLDERTRSAAAALLRALVHIVQEQLREHGARLLSTRGEEALAAALLGAEPVFERLARSGLLRDPELIGELLGRVRQDALGAALPAHAHDDPEQPGLIDRFARHPDPILAAAATELLVAESRRSDRPDTGHVAQTDLPAELHHRLVWWVAAALCQGASDLAAEEASALERTLADAAEHSLAAYDEGDRLEAAAMRLAAAIDAQPRELADLLVEAIEDRRIVLFVALLAFAIGVPYASARALVLDCAGERLWLALRAFELPREPIARIGFALCEADPRRDVEAFADTLDAVAAVDGDAARAALTALRHPPEFRMALAALETRP